MAAREPTVSLKKLYDPDAKLIEAIAKGEVGAFEELYSKYFPRLMYFAKRSTSSAEAAEEVANDVLMVVWRSADRFEGRSKASTWMFGIAYRMVLKHQKKARKLRGEVELNENLLANEKDTEDTVILSTDLCRALEQLSPQLRSVVELTYYNGFLYSEIADILECPVGTVKTRMMTARMRLRRILEDSDP